MNRQASTLADYVMARVSGMEKAASHQDTSGGPFLLKLPGQTAGPVYSTRFNTVATRRPITGILNTQDADRAPAMVSIEGTRH